MHTGWVVIAVGIVAAVVLLVAIPVIYRRRRTMAVDLGQIQDWASLEAAERIRKLETWASQTDRSDATTAAGLIMLGCAWIDRGLPERAVRPCQRAYHMEPGYKSAMLLAFSCMKVNREDEHRLLERIVETWRETGCPEIGHSHVERVLLSNHREDSLPDETTAVGAAIGSLPSWRLREQLRVAMAERPDWADVLRKTAVPHRS